MHASQFFFNTQKEAPSDAELPSHILMVRAGLIKRLGSGLYSWMPLGLRVNFALVLRMKKSLPISLVLKFAATNNFRLIFTKSKPSSAMKFAHALV